MIKKSAEYTIVLLAAALFAYITGQVETSAHIAAISLIPVGCILGAVVGSLIGAAFEMGYKALTGRELFTDEDWRQ